MSGGLFDSFIFSWIDSTQRFKNQATTSAELQAFQEWLNLQLDMKRTMYPAGSSRRANLYITSGCTLIGIFVIAFGSVRSICFLVTTETITNFLLSLITVLSLVHGTVNVKTTLWFTTPRVPKPLEYDFCCSLNLRQRLSYTSEDRNLFNPSLDELVKQ